MLGIVGIIALLTVLGLSLIITRLATTALSHTGLSQEAARFQARSAFTGTGFTTNEAEMVVSHPVRRRIIMLLMIVRSAGLITILISIILSFVGVGGTYERLYHLLGILVGVGLLWWIANNRRVDRHLSRVIDWALDRWTELEAKDYAGLLKLSGDYAVSELAVKEGDWIANRQLSECRLRDEGVVILGITREDGSYVGAPKGDTTVYPSDNLVLYGRSKTLSNLDKRGEPEGGREHHQAVQEHRQDLEKQDRMEARQEAKQGKDHHSGNSRSPISPGKAETTAG